MSLIHLDTAKYPFKFEPFLRQEYSFSLDPDRPICEFYNSREGPKSCPRGPLCPKKHVLPIFQNKIVWAGIGFVDYVRRMTNVNTYMNTTFAKPECVFFSKNGYCTQSPDCQYLHIDPASKIPKCENYEMGFCPLGNTCPRRHIKKVFCQRYMTGFCPLGKDECDMEHPQFIIPDEGSKLRIKKDDEINTRKMDEEKERRLNAIINGEV